MDKHKLWDDDTAEFHFWPVEDEVITKMIWYKNAAYEVFAYKTKW